MKFPLCLALLGLGLAGCSSSAQKETETVPYAAGAPQPAEPAPASPSPASTVAPAPVPRAVVYRGDLNLAVDDFEQTATRIDQLVARHRSYLDTAHETRANGEHQQDMTLKVPPTEFIALVADLGKLGRINSKDISSADVTADLLDAQATLQAQQTTADQLRQLQIKTTDPAQLRRVATQLGQTQQEADATRARLRDTSGRSAWAVLHLRFAQLLPAEEPAPSLPAFQPRWLAAFNWGWSALLEIVVLLTNLWPLLLLSGAGAWLLRRWRLRHPADSI